MPAEEGRATGSSFSVVALHLFQSKDSAQKGGSLRQNTHPSPVPGTDFVAPGKEEGQQLGEAEEEKQDFLPPFFFFNKTKCNVMPTSNATHHPCGGLRLALAALTVSSQEPPEQRAPARAPFRPGAAPLQAPAPSARLGAGRYSCSIPLPPPSVGCKNKHPPAVQVSTVSRVCSAALQPRSTEGTLPLEHNHVMLHHFGGHPLHVKWWRAQLHPSVAAIACRSTDYISVVMPLSEKRS